MGGRLFRKYALIFSALVGLSLLLSGVLNIYFSYQENKQALILLQQEKAQAAAQRIGQYLTDLEHDIAATNEPKKGVAPLDQRITEIELLRRIRALREISLLDPQGKEVLWVSRLAADVRRSGRDFSEASWFNQVKTGRPYRSPVYFRDDALFMTVVMAVGPQAAGITVAEVDLEFLLEGISRIKVGESGLAYAVDEQGHLIAHPDMGLVLKHSSMAALPQVQMALKNPLDPSLAGVDARDLAGGAVLTSFGVIPYLNWLIFVQQPLAEAYRPLVYRAVRSALLVLVGMVLTVLATVALVGKMVRPIRALRSGAKQIAQGVFDRPIVVRTGDELEELAEEFNRMAKQLSDSYASLERKVEQRPTPCGKVSSRSRKRSKSLAWAAMCLT